LQSDFDDTAFSKITLPHCVAPLSWQNWEPSAREDVWVYRRHFTVSADHRGLRTFLHFDRVMAGAAPVLNGRRLPQHLGGFLPFKYEVTDLVKEKNVLSVAVDARWLNVPPSGSPKGPRSVDYLLPGGINGLVEEACAPRCRRHGAAGQERSISALRLQGPGCSGNSDAGKRSLSDAPGY
jgi:beta-galactosidase